MTQPVTQYPLSPETARAPRSRILIVDDHPVNVHALFEMFADEHDLFVARSGEQALELCRADPPDLVLMDVMMPGIGGLEACRRLKRVPGCAAVPVIFVTALGDADEETRCWEAGCVDFVTKPVNGTTLRKRVNVHLLLKHQADTLRQMAWIDGLTGARNRRFLDTRLQEEWLRAQRNETSLALLMVDLDDFKSYNDLLGHLAGDDCLLRVASVIEAHLRKPHDILCRYGGEEFACILPETDIAGALALAHRLVEKVRDLALPHPARADKYVTVSIGAASLRPGEGVALADLALEADRQLYRAKSDGKARARAAVGTLSSV